jgi:microcystin-dependent protein
MSHLLDEILSEAANGSPATVALSSESVAVLLFASEFIERRENWLDRGVDPLDEVTDADWDEIEKLVGNAFHEIMTPIDLTPIGAIAQWAIATPPAKWLICDGQSLVRADYAELFAVLGTNYGAADAAHFYVPDYRNYSPMGAGSTVAIGGAAGTLQQSLSTTQMPSHSHTITDPGHDHDEQINGVPAYLTPGGTLRFGFQSITTNSLTRAKTDTRTTGIIATNNAGSGGLVNMLHPVRGINFIIYAGV